MKQIITNVITYLDALRGSETWYWGMDYTHGDLYENDQVWESSHARRTFSCSGVWNQCSPLSMTVSWALCRRVYSSTVWRENVSQLPSMEYI